MKENDAFLLLGVINLQFQVRKYGYYDEHVM